MSNKVKNIIERYDMYPAWVTRLSGVPLPRVIKYFSGKNIDLGYYICIEETIIDWEKQLKIKRYELLKDTKYASIYR